MLDPQQRFEILGTLASGDYATVLRARDRELGREVAIKQIHPQFLQDPKQLDRYWKEAQLLASLEHPHIMTIYDIVRDRGWLVLELMQGSLQQLLAGRPIDLNDLRMALTYIAHALQFMHQNGIVHGDVKPSNLLVDKNHRVKLGDFGIARRIAGEHGSVVKGTTKYMAPEVVSDQFGPVGPHSDLYSLGFSAYELLCGENFETLFPGLNMFGRDRQMAWLMWHSAPDRRLPEINRVLQGVPPDLAFIIQKLIEKDPARRYRTADQLLDDLRRQATTEAGPTPEELAAAALAERRARNRRWLSLAACVLSIGLSLSMVFWPSKPPPAPPPVEAKPTDGLIDEIDLDKYTFFLKHEGASLAKGIIVDPNVDRIFVNDSRSTFADLRPSDRVKIKYLTADGAEFLEVYAQRPLEMRAEGRVAEVNAGAAELKLADEEGQPPRAPWYVPAETVVTINDQRSTGNRPFTLAELHPEDRVTVSYFTEDGGRLVARSIIALRTLQAEGELTGRNPQAGKVTVQPATGGAPREFTIARECVVTLNGQDKSGDVPLTIADLVPGDRVTLTFDVLAHRVEARRDVAASGAIADIQPAQRTFTITTGDPPKSLAFGLAANCEIVGPQQKPVEFEFLRKGDQVDVEFAPLEAGKIQAIKIVARPAPDPRTWAIIIGQYQYDDAKLAPLAYGPADLQLVRDALLHRYRVPAEQLLTLENGSRLQIQQGVTEFVARIPADAQMLCYYEGHSVLDKSVGPVLTPKEFDVARAAETGVPLRWLVTTLESSLAREKIFFLDSAHSGADAASEPSAAEQAEAIKTKPIRPVSTSVLVIASCDRQQRGLTTSEGREGVFGSALASAFAGGADANRDGRVAVAELLEYLPSAMAAAAGANQTQTPVVFPPDNKPPRLTAGAQEAVRKMLGHLRGTRWDEAITAEFQAGEPQLGGQPDLTVAFGLVLLRHGRTPLSRPLFEKVRLAHPKSVVAHQALAWHAVLQGRLVDGVTDLRLMVVNLPDTKTYPAAEPYVKYCLQWAGAIREYVLSAADPPLERKDVEDLDRAVIALGDAAKESYRQGIESARAALARIDEELRTAPSERRAAMLLDRRRLTYYTSFNFGLLAEFLRQSLED